MSELVTLFGILFAFAAEPDSDNPFAPIYFDKESYSWTDKVIITIVAPSWNTSPNVIDTIGGDDERYIQVSTSRAELRPYMLSETEPNSGIFRGEVILAGFLHDVDGDGDDDTQPRTHGRGPTNGFLESYHDDAVTVSFAFTKDVVLTKTVPISWNIGDIEFLEKNSDSAIIRVTDADMNLNPELLDSFTINVSSDSDRAGVDLDVIESLFNSGIFEGTVHFTNVSSGKLFVLPDDTVIATYDDYTLPDPYTTLDNIMLTDSITILSDILPIHRASLFDVTVSDSFGTVLSASNVGTPVQIAGTVENRQTQTQDFVLLYQITNQDGFVVSISWVTGQLAKLQTLDISQSWTPKNSGTYNIELFVWNSLSNPIPLSNPYTISHVVGE